MIPSGAERQARVERFKKSRHAPEEKSHPTSASRSRHWATAERITGSDLYKRTKTPKGDRWNNYRDAIRDAWLPTRVYPDRRVERRE
jgi:hypothetical protein